MSQVMRQWLVSLGLAPRKVRARIFISYRRRDGSAGYAGRIADRLTKDFGEDQCFRDVEDIETGTDFVEAIEQAVGSCDALVVVIGPDWLTTVNPNGQRRLDDPRDFVRLEIAAALHRGIRVIPVLVSGAAMPAAEELPPVIEKLAYRQAIELTDTRWDYDVGRLVASLESMGIPRASAAHQKPGPNYRSRMIAAVIGVVLLVGGAIGGASMAARALLDSRQTADALKPLFQPAGDSLGALHDQAGISQSGGGQQGASEKGSSPPAVANESEKARIIRVMNVADSVSAEALRTHDASALAQFYTGAALAEQLSSVQMLVASGAHVHATLYGRTIERMELTGDRALANVVIEYELEFRTPDEQCVQRVPRHRSSQVTALVRQGGRWLIAQEQNNTPVAPQLCF